MSSLMGCEDQTLQGLEKVKYCIHYQKRLKEPGDHSPASLTSISRKTMEQVVLDDVAGHRKGVVGNRLQRLRLNHTSST